jgi:hypothetical protein
MVAADALPLMGGLNGPVSCGLPGVIRIGCSGRQPDFEGRLPSRLAGGRQDAAVAVDDAVGGRKPQADAVAFLLGV